MLRSRLIRSSRLFSTSSQVRADFTHIVIGAGAVGLAIGAEISKDPNHSVLVIEKNEEHGQETSSRNSEVIHAGLYYPVDSLKTELCILGKQLIYNECEAMGVEMKRCGKWIVAQNELQLEYLKKIHEKSKQLQVETSFVPSNKAKELEPSIRADYAVLNSPTTGIVSAHSLMNYQLSVLQNNDGQLAVGSEVVGLTYSEGMKEYEVDVLSEDGENMSISGNVLINCAGLYAPQVSNMLLPEERHLKAYYAKGNYFSFQGNPGIRRLIYPCPTPGVASLGTHLTLDLGGQMKFGPDLEWVDELTEDVYKVNDQNLIPAYNEVRKYFPSVQLENLSGSYSGIRPKLIGEDVKEFQDFVIRKEDGYPGFINCMGIESPGLTASMGIAKYVSNLL
ncbi:hypothetical protein CANARDRAFT_200494 [[Candida] arabinofermentans NRRL YB-2248]|uniref:L-2-hydroxyglutarate dehydrogenase, mitochondrial n=1 Tax=[Candida] arabinofermentans NRRL YB-2248 TaxID=983967 RepID=A0A1E4SYT5_9ASCO|nr:hypothetical protein CANARDRAFT_200494 [[Candida] arabinofermentans NRRL YB-2248]